MARNKPRRHSIETRRKIAAGVKRTIEAHRARQRQDRELVAAALRVLEQPRRRPPMLANETATSPWLRVDEAAAYARVHKSVIFRACRERKLEHVRVGGRGRVLTTAAWLDAWLQSLTVHVKAVRA